MTDPSSCPCAIGAALIAALVVGAPARAQDPQDPPSPEVLQRLEALEAEVARLRATQREPAGEPRLSPEPDRQPESPFPDLRITGFFQLDGGYLNQDRNNVATLGDIEDGLGFRRARLAAAGEVVEDVSFIMEFDFAQAQGRFVDVWLQFDETPLGYLRIGRFRQPFGMAELTSVRDLPFLERPTAFALAPFRQTGAMLGDAPFDGRMTWAVSGYRYLSDNYGNVFSDGGYGAATRITGAPLDLDQHGMVVHVGADYSYNDPGRGVVQFVSTNEYFNGQNPAVGLGGLGTLPIVGVVPFVNTGQMPTEDVQMLGAEAAASIGPALVQAEARWAHTDLGASTETFPALYAHVRWMLTGETIPYSRSGGVFGSVSPRNPVGLVGGGMGAWELAARISHIDLNGDGLPGPGRRLTQSTLGLGWYLNDHVRFQFNWLHSELDDPTLGGSQVDTFAFRGQLDF